MSIPQSAIRGLQGVTRRACAFACARARVDIAESLPKPPFALLSLMGLKGLQLIMGSGGSAAHCGVYR
eukprot:12773667-Alexandrium_andersonii.AAC.1